MAAHLEWCAAAGAPEDPESQGGPGSVVRYLALGALEGGKDLLLGRFSADPVGALDRLARLEVLVGLEEVLDLQAVELRHVRDVLEVRHPGVGRGHGEDLVVPARL